MSLKRKKVIGRYWSDVHLRGMIARFGPLRPVPVAGALSVNFPVALAINLAGIILIDGAV